MSFQKGINAWCFPKESRVEHIFQQAKEYGYKGVELNLDEGDAPLHLEMTEGELTKLAQLARDHGLELPSVSTALLWKYPLTHNDAEVREKGIQVVEKMIEAASVFEARTVLVVPGLVTPEVSYDTAYERAREALVRLAKTAEAKQVHIGIENVWNKFLLSPLEMARLIDEVNSPWVGAYFDVGNVLQFGFPEQWIRILGKRIRAIHVKDFKTTTGNITGFVPLLAGDIPWARVAEALREIGYSGYIIPEISPYAYKPEQLVASTSEALDAIFK
ncbi:xylulose 5-phosphate 3-epimerase [Brevibacillus parabrevis]|uniref:sugar phosphate isomerase/epimerase family protein n=1 Tax=Brevibacillus parabrevis TaxID=54914 RepID=UPI0007ABF1EC|nr:sugar phosphate isomerase/epimerase family protein [Brevibacillus parabrevis]KZE54651.1 xylulose 5-phosphate 3-epimerase [Brevibacillus parabrevis]